MMQFFQRLIRERIPARMKRNDERRLADQKPPVGVETFCNIPYVEDGSSYQWLDVYRPADATEDLPVIVDIHGGAWIYGDKDLNKNYAMTLASYGFVVVNVSYRLIHQAPFPAQLQDVDLALSWLKEYGSDYGADLDNVFITGDSAGAHLAALTAALAENPEAREKIGLQSPIRFRAIGLICGIYDIDRFVRMRNGLAKAFCSYYLDADYRNSVYLPLTSVYNVVNDRFPPAYLMSSQQDFLLKESQRFSARLKALGVPVEMRRWQKNAKPRLTHVFNVLYPEYNQSVITNKEMCNFFLQYKS